MKKKRLPPFAIIVLILVTIIGGGILYWNVNKKRIIRNELENAIRQKGNGLYKVHYDSLDLDEVNGHLSLTYFTLTFDSLRYAQLKQENEEPYLLFNISIPEIQISGVETPRALIDKEISGKHLKLINPVIEILYTHSGKDSSRNVPDKAIYEQILGNLHLIKLDSVVLSNAEIITKDLKTGKTLARFENVSISLLDVAVDSAANADTSRILFAREINFDCAKLAWLSRNGMYNYQVDSIGLHSSTSEINVKRISIKPELNEDAFAHKFSYQTDRFDFTMNNIRLKNTDVHELANEFIKAEELTIGSATFKIYRDRNIPPDNINRVGTYPQQVIQNIPVKFEIKTGTLSNTFLEYKERSSITHQSGKVQFWATSATMSNITNHEQSIKRNNKMVFDIQSRLLNQFPLSIKWAFQLGDPHGRFDIKGHSGSADATIFNALAIPMGAAQFKTGRIKSMDFDLSGTDYKINGTLKLLYTDFHLSMLKKDDDSIHFKKRRLVNLLANMKIKNNNPEGKDKPARIANINVSRDIHRSIFNFTWKSLFVGIKEATGAQ